MAMKDASKNLNQMFYFIPHEKMIACNSSSFLFMKEILKCYQLFYIIRLRCCSNVCDFFFKIDCYVCRLSAAPSVPKSVHIRNMGKDNLTLEWSAPDSDGGARIKKYIVEQSKIGTDKWTKVSNYLRNHCI